MLDLYEFKMSLFDHVKPEEFLLFTRNFDMTLASTGTLEIDTKIQYICTIFRGEVLCWFDLFSANLNNKETLNVD